ncbi:MAG: hypothetical protein IT582_06380 [Opitutaceae bacterium]|nr:hypothetical protein [Opitutaceae bacterium]
MNPLNPRRLILIGERHPAKPAHKGIEVSIHLFNRETPATIVPEWIPISA